MKEIALVLREAGASFHDRGLAWGARLSDYAAEIEAVVDAGHEAYAVELEDDMPGAWPARRSLHVVDHHGPLAGKHRPTSLEQILDLLSVPAGPRSRWRALVSANDRGHIAGMNAIGASAPEIAEVRLADRRAQGVTAAHEAEARTAIDRRVVDGRLTRIEVDLPSSTAVADLVTPELGGPGFDRLLVVMPDKLAVFADGALVIELADAVPRSWWGGALPTRGFWGAERREGLLAIVEAAATATP